MVKTIIIGTTDAQKRKNIVEIIYRDAVTNAQNPYGNYAITEIIINWPKTVCEPIFLAFRGHLSELSNFKYSSPVIEKCLEFAS